MILSVRKPPGYRRTMFRKRRRKFSGARTNIGRSMLATVAAILVLELSPPGRKNLQVRGAFVTTRWSLILSGANSKSADTDIRAALAEICRIYWRPIFAFVSQRGCSAADAEDLTQTFFVMILKSDWLQNADPCRGRFRSLLLKSLQNFLSDAADKTYARKRGGKVSFVS